MNHIRREDGGFANARIGPAELAAAATVLCVMVTLMLRTTPSHDDFYTLEYARSGSLQDLLRLHRDTANSTSPPAYIMYWLWAQVFGPSYEAAAALSILAWTCATLLIARMLQPMKPAAVFIGAIFPTISSLAYLGFAVRSYSVVLVLLTALVVLSGMAGPRRHTRADHAALFVLSSLACLLNYPSSFFIIFLAAAGLLQGRHDRQQLRGAGFMLGGTALAMALQIESARAAQAYGQELSSDEGQLRAGLLTQASLLRTWWPLFIGLALLAVLAGTGWWRDLKQAELMPSRVFCVATAVTLPVLTSVPFFLFGAAYHTRYALGVLIVVALLIGAAVDSLPYRSWIVAIALLPTVVASLALSVKLMQSLSPSRASVEAMEDALNLDRVPGKPILVRDQRAFMLLKEYADNPGRFALAAVSPTPISHYERRTEPLRGQVLVVMTRSDLEEFPDRSRVKEILGESVLRYSGKSLHLLLVRLAG